MGILEIRYMTEKDVPLVKKLFEESSAKLYTDFEPDDVDDTDFYVGAFISNKDQKRLVGICTIGSTIGTELERMDGEDCILSNVYVDTRFRDRGYGSAIVKKAIKLAAKAFSDKGCIMYADILDYNLANWYSRLGFEVHEIDSLCKPVSMKKKLH